MVINSNNRLPLATVDQLNPPARWHVRGITSPNATMGEKGMMQVLSAEQTSLGDFPTELDGIGKPQSEIQNDMHKMSPDQICPGEETHSGTTIGKCPHIRYAQEFKLILVPQSPL